MASTRRRLPEPSEEAKHELIEATCGRAERHGKPALFAGLHPPGGKEKGNACPACKPGATDAWRSTKTLRNHASRARRAPGKPPLHREKWHQCSLLSDWKVAEPTRRACRTLTEVLGRSGELRASAWSIRPKQVSTGSDSGRWCAWALAHDPVQHRLPPVWAVNSQKPKRRRPSAATTGSMQPMSAAAQRESASEAPCTARVSHSR